MHGLDGPAAFEGPGFEFLGVTHVEEQHAIASVDASEELAHVDTRELRFEDGHEGSDEQQDPGA